MIDRPPGPPLDGDTESRIAGDGMAGSGDANSDVCATSLAMAGHNLRQPPQVMGGAHDVLARIPHGGAAQAQPARPEDATRQLADTAYGRLRAASAAGEEHATGARREPSDSLPLAIFGPVGYGLRSGILGAPARATQAASPLLFGLLMDRMGIGVLAISAGLSLSAFFALLILRARPTAAPAPA
jgi:hypothetical protein